MLIYTKNHNLITAAITCGDNLTPADIEDGYVDYLETNLYIQDEYELVERDGGMLLLDKPADDFTQEELVYRLLDYWNELGESQVLEPLEKRTI